MSSYGDTGSREVKDKLTCKLILKNANANDSLEQFVSKNWVKNTFPVIPLRRDALRHHAVFDI